MFDIHSHLLPGIDDGSSSFEESLTMLKNAYDDGIRDIIITPHYERDGYFHSNKEANLKLLEELKERAKDIAINLYLGNEIYINENIIDDLKEGKVSTLANSNYLLVEFPFTYYDDLYDGILYDLKKEGYKIIIAHPERYSYVKEHYDFCLRWLNEGYLLQCNTTSLRHHPHTMEYLLKNKWVSFIASDGHNLNRPVKLKDAYNQILNEYGKEYADELFISNPRIIIESVIE